jgi:hypothetical protein
MKTHLEFRSDAFPAQPGEEEEVNPGRWGRLLADYLCTELRARGFAGQGPFAEDWGWLIPLENDKFALWIGCGNIERDAASALESDPAPGDQFLCFIEPSTPFVRKMFRKIDTTARVSELAAALEAALRAHPGVRDSRWWTDQEVGYKRAGTQAPEKGT